MTRYLNGEKIAYPVNSAKTIKSTCQKKVMSICTSNNIKTKKIKMDHIRKCMSWNNKIFKIRHRRKS